MSIKWMSKILLAKIETAYGTDPIPTGTANAILATKVTLSPMDGSDFSRALELPYIGAQPTIPNDLSAKIVFNVELVPSGTAGTAPAWGPLLRACGVAETIVATTSVTYNPITDNQESITIYIWIGGTQYKLTGCRGTVNLKFAVQAVPLLEFTITGLFNVASEVARPTATLTSFKAPLPTNTANTPVFTIASNAFVMRDFSLNLNNSVQGRFLVGLSSILIVDRSETASATVEAVPMTTYNPYAVALAQTQQAVVLTQGLAAGLITTLNLPNAQLQRPQTINNNQNIVEWTLPFVPVPTAGNDQWRLVLT